MNLGMAAPSSSASWKSGETVPDQFPAGLRVLVVDDDPTCLMILEKMLMKCLYEVTKCTRAEVALNLLRGNPKAFDVVISDVHMPDMDGFKLLEHVGLEMDLPVIMMSADDSKQVVMKGVTHGACDYLIKPVRMEALKNIWQHVVRKKKNEWKDKDFEQSGSVEEGDRQAKQNENDADYSSSANEGNWKSSSKKKRDEDDENEDKDDTSSLKKPRVVWSVELHQQFVAAVNQLGIDKAVPKKILELMNVPLLTRENVASHLQKYRLYLRRVSGVSPHQNGHFLGHQDPAFGSMPSLAGIDLQSFASSQIPAQSLASIQALGRPTSKPHISMPMADQRNLFSFESPKLRYGDPSQHIGSSNKQMNLLHGIPTNMEPKQLASLNQSAQSYGSLGVSVNPQLLQRSQASLPSHPPKLQSSIGPHILGNGMSNPILSQNNSYIPVSQSSPMGDFAVNNISDMIAGQGSNTGMSSLTNKGIFHDEVSSDLKSSRGSYIHGHGYDMFSDMQQQIKPAQDWMMPNVGTTFDSPISLDAVPPTSSVQQGFSSVQNQKSNHFSTNHFNGFMPENSLRVKTEMAPETSFHNNLFQQQTYGQDDLMSAYLKQQQEGIGAVDSDFGFDAYPLDNLPV